MNQEGYEEVKAALEAGDISAIYPPRVDENQSITHLSVRHKAAPADVYNALSHVGLLDTETRAGKNDKRSINRPLLRLFSENGEWLTFEDVNAS